MAQCLVCGGSFDAFISFGRMPLANGFLAPDSYSREYFFELATGACSHCGMVQLLEQPAPEQMFNDSYPFFSGTSRSMAEHFEAFAKEVMNRHLGPDPFVVEVGSNDGIMLHHFADAKIRHLGVEPSANVAEVARKRGVNSVSRFFNADFADEIMSQYGQADAFLGANVFCHISAIHEVAEGVRKLLKPSGVLIFEDPYLGDIIEKISYDQIYDEHVFYFSANSVSYLFSRHGLELIEVAPQGTHGGSMRYTLAHRGAYPVDSSVARQLAKEARLQLDKPETFDHFRQNIEQSRDQLLALLQEKKKLGQRVVGYGATSKSTTILNYCGIGPELIEFISDTTPIKQGKFTPGQHIPVKPYEAFASNPPEYALLFAWNHAKEILAKEKRFVEGGGRFITYVPAVGIIE